MGRPREKEYNLGDPDLPNKPDEAVIEKVIEYRWRKKEEKGKVLFESMRFKKRLPKLEFNLALETLFAAEDLWITVNGVRFTPDAVIKSLIVRSDGVPINWNKKDSSFIDSRKRKLESKFGVRPFAVWNKQKKQYWDEPFIRVFFASIQTDKDHPSGLFNHIAYTIRDKVNVDELKEAGKRVKEELLAVVTHPWNEYLVTRQKGR